MSKGTVYKVIGHTIGGEPSWWHYTNLEHANAFAKQLAGNTGEDVLVCQLIGTWKPQLLPVEYAPAEQGD